MPPFLYAVILYLNKQNRAYMEYILTDIKRKIKYLKQSIGLNNKHPKRLYKKTYIWLSHRMPSLGFKLQRVVSSIENYKTIDEYLYLVNEFKPILDELMSNYDAIQTRWLDIKIEDLKEY